MLGTAVNVRPKRESSNVKLWICSSLNLCSPSAATELNVKKKEKKVKLKSDFARESYV